jgi:GT2 family glycosyltransferase
MTLGDFPPVTCVVLNFNGRAVLPDTLTSLTAMTYPNFRLMMVDNGSTDDSVAYVRENFPAVLIIENGENLGVTGARNIAMRHAIEDGAAWVHHLDNDIRVDPGLLSALMDAAASDARIGILGAKIYYHAKPDLLWYAGGNVNYWTGMVTHRGIRRRDDGRYDRFEDTDYVVGCSFLMSKKLLDAVGYFDPIFTPFYTEDSDMCARALRAGFRVVYVPGAKLWHRVSTSSGGVITPKRVMLKIEYNLIYFRRYARWYHWLTIPVCVGGLSVAYLAREISKGNVAALPALFRGFRKALGRVVSAGDAAGAGKGR